MIPRTVVDRTVERYRSRSRERAQLQEKLRTGSPITADTPARVQKRMMRLAITEAARATVSPGAGVATLAPPVGLLERIIGRSDLMSVAFLELALAAARTVARIRIRTGSQTVGYGTGSLVGPRVLLTNNHVLQTAAEAAASLAEFNYQDGVTSPTVFALDPASLFVTDPALDYTVVAVREAGGDAPLTTFGFNRLIEQEGKVLVGECLNIVQHPNGELKQVALRENQLQDVLPQFLHYHTDTAPGSSGSPVFSDQWEMVALHHSGVPRTDAQGRYLTKDGTLWDPSMGEHMIDWVANEGVRVSQICAHLKQQNLSGTSRALRDSLFTAESTGLAATQPPGSATPAGAALDRTVRAEADGFATWTVPIEIRVRVGGQSAPAAPDRTTVQQAPAPAPSPAPPDADLQAALDAVEAGRTRKYFDAEKNATAKALYYDDIDTASSGTALFAALSSLLEQTHSPRPSYKPSLHVYPFVDLHPDGKIRSIYSQKTFSAEELVREDFRIEQERSRRLQEMVLAEGSLTPERLELLAARLEAELPFNCEHVVPQSWFAKAEPMKGDLHHLFACESDCNSFRGNIPYFDFPDFEEVVRTECGKREGDRFEPSAAKGIVARATLYFILRYPGQVNSIIDSYDVARLATLLSWHASHPVTDYELHRNMAIFEKQGNRNPLIDHPDWAAQIDFAAGL
jgi:endonuclease G, mitochondrial